MEELYEFNLRDYWNIFLKRKAIVIISFLIVFMSIFIYTSLQVPIYRASLLIKIDLSMSLPSDIIFPRQAYWDPRRGFELSDYAKQIVGKPIIETAAKELGWLTDEAAAGEKERLISDISSKVFATEIEKSNLIRLSAQFTDPQKAAKIVNKMAEVFKRVNAEQKNERNRNVRIFIEQTLNDVSATLKQQEERLRVLTTQGAVGLAVDIVQQIAELEKRLADLATKFTEKHPEVIRLKEETARLKKELQSLPKEEFEYGILKRDIAINEGLYTSLKQQLQTAQIKEAEKVDNVFLINPAVTPRTPFYPNKTKNYTVGMLLGIILGVVLALITEHLDTSIGRVDDIESFIKTSVLGIIPYCHETLKDEDAGRRRFRALFFRRKKVAYKPVNLLTLERTSKSIFAEAFRILGVNIQVLFGKGGRVKNKIIMITSCKPEEGKTSIISNLGVTLSQMGYKTLIIDGDIRRASLHKIFGLKGKENGFTDVLMGKISPDSAILTATDLMLGFTYSIDKIMDKPWLNNLNLVTAGAVFPNPINLFNSDKMDEVLNYFKGQYDIVLIDTSPILAVSEPSILIPKVDGVILVYRAGSTSRLALRRAKIQIESIKGKGALSGVILNNVTPEIGVDTYYYYSKKYYTDDKKPSAEKEEKLRDV